MKKHKSVTKIAAKHLGKKSKGSQKYNPSLLVRIPRKLNREKYGLTKKDFVGTDVWVCHETSFMLPNGFPINGILKFTTDSSSKFHVESKSLKLYLNSFNTDRSVFSREAVKWNPYSAFEEIVRNDLSNLLDTNISCHFHPGIMIGQYKRDPQINQNWDNLVEFINTEVEFPDHGQLRSLKVRDELCHYRFSTDLLRSNCRVTFQPDWGDLLVDMVTDHQPDFTSIAQYIVGHRDVSHFHEEVCEMIFRDLRDVFKPESLLVTCLYTRRGGVSINPVRATDRIVTNTSPLIAGLINVHSLREYSFRQ